MNTQKPITTEGITFELGEFGTVKIRSDSWVNLSDLIKAATKLRKRLLDKAQKDAAAIKAKERKKAAKEAKRQREIAKKVARRSSRKPLLEQVPMELGEA